MPTLHWIGKDKVINHHLDVPYKVLEHQYGFGLAEPSEFGEVGLVDSRDLEADKIQSSTNLKNPNSDNHSSEFGKVGFEDSRDLEAAEIQQSTNPKNPNLDNHPNNKIIHGDNLEALKSLLPEYEGKIKCIYIDPPYNTGNESWVYNDNVNDPKIKKWLGNVVGKEAEDLTRHDKWLCMMYPRLKLLHKLLADDGAIFISIDDNEQANLKLMMDEIFGGGNFIANVAVVNNFKGRSDDKYIATAHESLIVYQKGKFITNGVPVPEEYIEEYKLKDEIGQYRLQGLRKRGSGAKREDRPNMYYPFYFNPKHKLLSFSKNSEIDIEILPKLSDGSDGRWRWGKETAIERINELTSQLVKGRNEFDVFQKDYLRNGGTNKSIKPKSFWHGSEFSSEAGTLQLKKIFEKKSFQTPKSVDFIQFCLHQATNKNSIILDSFAGSGTTAHAVLNLNKQDGGNRKFILIEMEAYAETITAERVKRVINGYGNTEGTGGNFDFYTLGEPLFLEDGLLNENLPLQKSAHISGTRKRIRALKKERRAGICKVPPFWRIQMLKICLVFLLRAPLKLPSSAKIKTRLITFTIIRRKSLR